MTLEEGAEAPSRADLIVFCRDRIGYKAPDEIVFLAPEGHVGTDRFSVNLVVDADHPGQLDRGVLQ